MYTISADRAMFQNSKSAFVVGNTDGETHTPSGEFIAQIEVSQPKVGFFSTVSKARDSGGGEAGKMERGQRLANLLRRALSRLQRN